MFQIIITCYRLGIINLFRVFSYKILLKLGLHPVQRLHSSIISGHYFHPKKIQLDINPVSFFPYDLLLKGFWPFSSTYINFSSVGPEWHKNYFNGKHSPHRNQQWWTIPDFDPEVGDVKTVWELSRFDWVIQFACWGATGNLHAIHQLNQWLEDWIKHNIPYVGVNWKCGQEASIRVLHLLSAAQILQQFDKPTNAFLNLLEIHLKRIKPTIGYAISQRNNHGPSEAAALFAGGYFLSKHGRQEYSIYSLKGRKLLEERALVLFDEEGCFSQYSVNYHRLVLDLYSFCETFRKLNDLPTFSKELISRLQAATRWLGLLTDEHTGDAPNIGANDGAKLFPFFKCDFRDYRFSVQWASISFFQKSWFTLSNVEIQTLMIIGLKINSEIAKLNSNHGMIKGSKGGFYIYRKNRLLFIFRRPIFRFRPAHADALHVDLWIDGINLLRDGGSFSYNGTPDKMAYYSGVRSHNTVMIDGKEPMPKISRFLYSSWLSENVFQSKEDGDNIEVSSGYTDYLGRTHHRQIKLSSGSLRVIDNLEGVQEVATISWRLTPDNWQFEENSTKCDCTLKINYKERKIEYQTSIDTESESRYYMSEMPIEVVKKSTHKSGFIETLITW